MTIIVIMTMVMLISLFEDRENRELAAASRSITAALRETQNNALSGLTRSENVPCVFTFRLEADAHFHSKASERLPAPNSSCDIHTIITDYTLGYDVEHDYLDPDSVEAVRFSVPHGNVSIDNDDNPSHDGSAFFVPTGVSQIKLSGSSKAVYVCIYPSGQIVENGINECS